ncbi:hypothetical protein DPEC_G00115200 [Dallia pectoralis]|uniref:Uncharacterized protein n=1 Tax=Dallia pectoralis TaxID=75939 RepID=A0ACC2GTV7_DALPE|nr:hypothetical protein DPEC_G00115200 [Dallia pectoralis]
MPKPSVYPRKAPVPLPPQAAVRSEPVAMTTSQGSPARQPRPPPVPPEACHPCREWATSTSQGRMSNHPLLRNLPLSLALTHIHIQGPLPFHTGHADVALNLSPSSESRPGFFSVSFPPLHQKIKDILKPGAFKDGAATLCGVTLALERLDSYTDASLEAIAALLEALSSPCVPGDGQYQMQREILEMESSSSSV